MSGLQKSTAFRIASRGLIVQNEQLLLVSNDGEYWYLPGGQLEKDEDLPQCVEREVYEETGLVVSVGQLLHVLECMDVEAQLHKVHFYFRAEIIRGQLNPAWEDEGCVVQYRRFFSLQEIEQNTSVLPRFLSLGTWLGTEHNPVSASVYQGMVYMKGFEVLENYEDKALLVQN